MVHRGLGALSREYPYCMLLPSPYRWFSVSLSVKTGAKAYASVQYTNNHYQGDINNMHVVHG